MSRCYPYPPPGYESSRPLSESLKLRNETDRAKKDRKKEKSRDKKDKKDKSREFVDKKHGHKKRHRDERSQLDKKSTEHPKRREDEVEHLEKSSLTEEQGPPSIQYTSDSPDSSQKSNKRRKHDATDVSPISLGSGLRIRWPSFKHIGAEPLVQQEQTSVKCKEAEPLLPRTQAFVKHNDAVPFALREQPVLKDLGQPALRGQPLLKEPGQLALRGQPVLKEPGQLALREQPVLKKPGQLAPRKQPVLKEPGQLAPRKQPVLKEPGQLAPRKQPVLKEPGQLAPRKQPVLKEPGRLALREQLCITKVVEQSVPVEQPCFSGRTEATPVQGEAGPACFDLSSFKRYNGTSSSRRKEEKFQELIVNWNPPPIQTEMVEEDDQDWLFGSTQRLHEQVQRRCHDESEASSTHQSTLCSWPPRACYLKEADIYALPYVIPF